MIKLIDINKIHHHPDNPRKNLGDLTELTDSIKRSGILQNLTLVPIEGKEDEFYAVIGNRRLAAAEMAGLEEVPCVISDMDYKTQIATMLSENMQRSDLTVYEQAQGFQMMMDLGETVSNISEKTGFSESTVRRRTKLLELDQDKFKESVERDGNLMDYMELSKIKDISKRNEVLEHIGTDDFKWKLNVAMEEEKQEEIKGELIKKLEKFATKIGNTDVSRMSYCESITYDEDNLKSEIKFQEDKKYYFVVHSWAIALYEEMDNVETEEDAKKREEEEREREKQRKKDSKIKEIKERTSQLRKDFIYSLSNTKVKSCMDEIILLMLKTRASFYLWDESYIKIFELKTKEEDFDFKEIEVKVLENPELSLFKIFYMEELDSSSYFDFRGRYCEDEELDDLYSILTKLGYKMSEEEIALKNSTHELFTLEG